MTAADTSVVVAAFASWHEQHKRARAALREATRLVGHCAFETYSVLTRLPAPHRAPASVVSDFLSERFEQPYLTLKPKQQRELVSELAALDVTGGAVYDALVGHTAAGAGAELLTLDRRALETYKRCGVSATLL